LSFPPHPFLLHRILILATVNPVFSLASSIEENSSVCPSLKVARQEVFNSF